MSEPRTLKRRLSCVLMAGPVLLLAADLVGAGAAHPVDPEPTRSAFGAWTAQHVLLLVGTATMVVVFLTLMRLADDGRPTVALGGAVLGVTGVLAAVSILALDFAAVQVAEFGDRATMRSLYQRVLDGPVISALDILQVALPLGVVVLALALLANRRVPRWISAALVVSAFLSGPALPGGVTVLGRLLLLAGLGGIANVGARTLHTPAPPDASDRREDAAIGTVPG